jgi:hypothetical protein
VFGNVWRNAAAWIGAAAAGSSSRRAEHWLSLVYYAGYCRELWWPTRIGMAAPERNAPSVTVKAEG